MSVRVTKKIRRVIDRLARGTATGKQLSEDTNIAFTALWVIVDKLEAEGWIKENADQRYELTQTGRDGIRAEDEKTMAHSRPGPRRDRGRR